MSRHVFGSLEVFGMFGSMLLISIILRYGGYLL